MNQYRRVLQNPEIVAAHLTALAFEKRLPVREMPRASPQLNIMPDLVDYYFEILDEVQKMEPHDGELPVV